MTAKSQPTLKIHRSMLNIQPWYIKQNWINNHAITFMIGSNSSKSIFPAMGLKLKRNSDALTFADINSNNPRRIVEELGGLGYALLRRVFIVIQPLHTHKFSFCSRHCLWTNTIVDLLNRSLLWTWDLAPVAKCLLNNVDHLLQI